MKVLILSHAAALLLPLQKNILARKLSLQQCVSALCADSTGLTEMMSCLRVHLTGSSSTEAAKAAVPTSSTTALLALLGKQRFIRHTTRNWYNLVLCLSKEQVITNIQKSKTIALGLLEGESEEGTVLCVVLQLLEESRVYQVIPFMTHLELNHIKDDKMDSEKAHKGQEAVKLVNAGLQPEYRGRFKLQVALYCPALSCPALPCNLTMCTPSSQKVCLHSKLSK